MSKRNKSGPEGFLDIVAKILIIMALLMGISLMASLSSNRVELPVQPTTPVDDGLIHFKVYTSVCPNECDGANCYNDYVEYTCEEGLNWMQFAESDANDGCTYYSTLPDSVGARYHTDDGGHDGYLFPDVKPTDLIVDGAVYGSPDLIP